MRNEYVVVPVAGPEAGKPSAVAGAVPSERGQNYLSVKLNGDHTFQKCGIADLNGDGVYDYVIKQPSANIDPYEMYWRRSPETYKIEAYLGDGTFLWRYDMGWAIERGIWYSPVVVYDLDGDGRAEVCLKAGEGDPRDSDGRVQSGPEYLLVLDGMTGQEKAHADWPPPKAFPSYNYASRNQLAVAFLDGKTPCLIVVQGTYHVIQVRAYEYRSGDCANCGAGANRKRAAPIAVKAPQHARRRRGRRWPRRNLLGLGGPGRQRRRAVVHRPGTSRSPLRRRHRSQQARAGGVLSHRVPPGEKRLLPGRGPHGKNPLGPGPTDPARAFHGDVCRHRRQPAGHRELLVRYRREKKSNVRWLFDCRGNILRDDLDWGFGLRTVWWDADLQRELVQGRRIFKYRSARTSAPWKGSRRRLRRRVGRFAQELIVSRPGELRIYSTTIPAIDRRVCLMQDPIYRLDVCLQAMGYTQCPMTTK